MDRPDELGVEYGHVRLADDRAGSWPREFNRICGRIRDALGASAAAIEHVGSTAVPGLAAKPIIDIVVGLSTCAREADVTARLEGLGFEFRGDKGDNGGLLFVLEDAPKRRIAHLHVVSYEGVLWTRYLGFRDLLRSDDSVRAQYERLKRELAGRFPGDRAAYTAAKATFVNRVLDEL